MKLCLKKKSKQSSNNKNNFHFPEDTMQSYNFMKVLNLIFQIQS